MSMQAVDKRSLSNFMIKTMQKMTNLWEGEQELRFV